MWKLFDILFPIRTDERRLRDTSDDSFRTLLQPVPVSKTTPETIALFPFAHPAVRSAIHEAKYHGTERPFSIFAEAVADYVRDMDERSGTCAFIPIPLGKLRRKERGFNQIEEVARRAAVPANAILMQDVLLRTRETESQISLSREKRQENMRGAFGVAHTLDPRTTYVLLDDVITTGATMQAAIDALKEAGATRIVPIAIAH